MAWTKGLLFLKLALVLTVMQTIMAALTCLAAKTAEEAIDSETLMGLGTERVIFVCHKNTKPDMPLRKTSQPIEVNMKTMTNQHTWNSP
jgi:hypothetical protein